MDSNGQEDARYEDVPYVLVYATVSCDKPMLLISGSNKRSNLCLLDV